MKDVSQISEFFSTFLPYPTPVSRNIIRKYVDNLNDIAYNVLKGNEISDVEYQLLQLIGRQANKVKDFDPINREFVSNVQKLTRWAQTELIYGTDYIYFNLKTLFVFKIAGKTESKEELLKVIKG